MCLPRCSAAAPPNRPERLGTRLPSSTFPPHTCPHPTACPALLPLQYIDWLLGYNSPPINIRENINTHAAFPEAEVAAIADMMAQDSVLYAAALARFHRQRLAKIHQQQEPTAVAAAERQAAALKGEQAATAAGTAEGGGSKAGAAV